MIELIAISLWAGTTTAIPAVVLGWRRARRTEAEALARTLRWSGYFDWLAEASAFPSTAPRRSVPALSPVERVA